MTVLDQHEVDECAAMHNIDPLALRSQTLLHIPRLSADGGVPGPGDFRDEMFRLAALLQARTKNYAHHLAPPRTELTLDHLEFIKLDETIAKKLHENFHYIGSYRPGFHFGYLDKTSGKIVCIGSVALCDLAHVIDKIKDKIVPAEAFTYTRFFAFRWAPANTFSHFTKRLSSHLIKNFSTKILFTFINPNLGFSGGSFIGAGFKPFALEEGTHYMYFNSRYLTMRHLIQTHGTSDPTKLRKLLGESFLVSQEKLLPMEILAKPLTQRANLVIPKEPYLFQRPIL